VVSEAGSRGKVISDRLATALVDRVGTDLGRLSYEVLKFCTYLDSTDETEVQPQHLRGTLIEVGEVNFIRLFEALQTGSEASLIRIFERLKLDMGDTNDVRTLKISTTLSNQVALWLHALSLEKDGADINEACQRMKVTPYRYEKILLPIARRWGKENLINLIGKLSDAYKMAKGNRIDAWTWFESTLIGACHGLRQPG
jgi:DNA polymerase III delta subunit